MKLYHGSNLVIEQIDLYQSKPCKDFGRRFYTSDTYAKLSNPKTGLYFQSPNYVYAYLEHELATGVMG